MDLRIDDKWSVRYDPENNDRPAQWLRHGEPHSDFEENNAATAMFYALLECRKQTIEHRRELVLGVRAAFDEGFVAGADDGWTNNPRMTREWIRSNAKKGLRK